MKSQSKYIITLFLLLLFIACSDENDVVPQVKLAQLENNKLILFFDIKVLQLAFNEELKAGFEAVNIDTVFIDDLNGIAKGPFIIGMGTVRQKDPTGSIVSGQIVSRIQLILKDNFYILSKPNVSKGESCSGAPCESCAFNPNGGCTCLLLGSCNHTIIKAHDTNPEPDGDKKGFNRLY